RAPGRVRHGLQLRNRRRYGGRPPASARETWNRDHRTGLRPPATRGDGLRYTDDPRLRPPRRPVLRFGDGRSRKPRVPDSIPMPLHPRRRPSARGLWTPWNRGLRGVPARAGAAALLALAAAGGCAPPPLADIDRQTDRLISAQSAELGRSSLAPDRAFREPRAYLNPRYRQAE